MLSWSTIYFLWLNWLTRSSLGNNKISSDEYSPITPSVTPLAACNYMQHVIDLGLQLSHHDLLESASGCVKNLVSKILCQKILCQSQPAKCRTFYKRLGSNSNLQHDRKKWVTSSNQDNDVMNYICYFFYFKCYFCSILFSYFYCQAV